MRDLGILGLICIIIQAFAALAFGSAETIGTNGINSAGLALTGSGISLGLVEDDRPGLPAFDGASSHSSVVPAAIFEVTTGQGSLTPGANTDDHPQQVAGIMISNDTTAKGVAPGASLYASAHLTGNSVLTSAFDQTMLTIQHIATQPNMRAVNHSWQKLPIPGDQFDGNSQFALGLDWSASTHDVLHVVAGFNLGQNTPQPKDNYNGMTIGTSSKWTDGVYRLVDSFNGSPVSPPDGRTIIDLIAPGIDVRSTQLNNMLTPPVPNTSQVDDGTSFAAPHVTGTVALLQEHAGTRIGQAAEWNREFNNKPTAYRHEVMKSVLMNSTDKFIDNGTVVHPTTGQPIPEGRLLGMERTVIKQDFNSTWFESFAYNDGIEGGGEPWPLDDEMGTGHLNAKRALQQFIPGEWDHDGGDIPNIGWAYDTITGTGVPNVNRYQFDEELAAENFISITLAWDREVTFSTDTAPIGVFNEGDEFAEYQEFEADDVINDLDIYLMPKFAGSIGQAIAASTSSFGTVEHLFFEIPETGEYEFWVLQNDTDTGNSQNYGLAWWYGLPPPIEPPTQTGDFDADGDVDGRDFLAWQRGQSPDALSASDLADWQANYGTGSLSAVSVPEPGCLVLLFGAIALLRRR